jgi:opacity protein-like surface antigen
VLPARSQTFVVGGKIGVPINDAFLLTDPTNPLSNYSFKTNRYTFGPAGELKLPLKLAFEASALYRRLNYDSTPFSFSSVHASTKGRTWEFPLLVKRYFSFRMLQPYGGIGVSLRRVQGSTNLTSQVIQATQEPIELVKKGTTGVVVAGGVDVPFRAIHFFPEIRFTGWGEENFISPNNLFKSNLHSVDFMLGVGFAR